MRPNSQSSSVMVTVVEGCRVVSTSGVVLTMETVKSSSPGVSTTSSSTMSNLAHARVSPGWKVTVAIAAPKSWPSVVARHKEVC